MFGIGGLWFFDIVHSLTKVLVQSRKIRAKEKKFVPGKIDG